MPQLLCPPGCSSRALLEQKQHLVCLQLREKEAEADGLIGPVEEMYALLRRYEVRVPAEELTAVSDLRYSWKKLLDLAVTVSDNLSGLQVSLTGSLTAPHILAQLFRFRDNISKIW